MFIWEGWLFDNLGLAKRSGVARLKADVIQFPPRATHPAAGGLTGASAIFDKPPAKINYAVGLGDATVIARERRGWRRHRPVYFAYDVGDTLANGTTAGVRIIGWFLTDDGWDSLNDSDWDLFDAAIDWLTT